jgi:hypothetical protein
VRRTDAPFAAASGALTVRYQLSGRYHSLSGRPWKVPLLFCCACDAPEGALCASAGEATAAASIALATRAVVILLSMIVSPDPGLPSSQAFRLGSSCELEVSSMVMKMEPAAQGGRVKSHKEANATAINLA